VKVAIGASPADWRRTGHKIVAIPSCLGAERIMMRRKVALIVSIVFACSLLATDEDVTFAAQQDSGGFFGRLFRPDQPPTKRPRRRRPGGSTPFLSSPDQRFWGQPFQPWGQPFFKKPKPVQKAQPSEPPLPTVEVKAKDPKARKILVIGDFLAS